MSKDNGGHAFPLAFEDATTTPDTHVQYGMTLRDYFAAKAMQSFIADMVEETTAQKLADCSYSVAEAMLKARSQ